MIPFKMKKQKFDILDFKNLTINQMLKELVLQNKFENFVVFYNGNLFYKQIKSCIIENKFENYHLKSIGQAKLHLVSVFDEKSNEKIVLQIEKESNFEIFHTAINLSQKNFDFVFDVNLLNNVNLGYYLFKTGYNFNFQIHFNLNENVNFKHNLWEFCEKNCVNDIKVDLMQKNSKAVIRTFTFAFKNANIKNNINLIHYAKQTQSEVENFAVANDYAKIFIDGTNEIKEKSGKSVARQKSKIICLTQNVSCICVPKLLIHEHDVVASHSAEIGQLDKRQLYYLQSRGLSFNESKKLLLQSIATPFLQGHFQEKLIENLIDRKIN